MIPLRNYFYAALLAVFLVSCGSRQPEGRWTTDVGQTHIYWEAGMHGTLMTDSGNLQFGPAGNLTGGILALDLRTIKADDTDTAYSHPFIGQLFGSAPQARSAFLIFKPERLEPATGAALPPGTTHFLGFAVTYNGQIKHVIMPVATRCNGSVLTIDGAFSLSRDTLGFQAESTTALPSAIAFRLHWVLNHD